MEEQQTLMIAMETTSFHPVVQQHIKQNSYQYTDARTQRMQPITAPAAVLQVRNAKTRVLFPFSLTYIPFISKKVKQIKCLKSNL
jgi:hypothetical protein